MAPPSETLTPLSVLRFLPEPKKRASISFKVDQHHTVQIKGKTAMRRTILYRICLAIVTLSLVFAARPSAKAPTPINRPHHRHPWGVNHSKVRKPLSDHNKDNKKRQEFKFQPKQEPEVLAALAHQARF